MSRITPLILGLLLQALPFLRVAVSNPLFQSSSMAIVFRWLAGTAVTLGGYHAVSGASTVINSPTTAKGTNGVPFTYRITTGPHAANLFSASPLPPGLTVSTTSGKISGTPTAEGLWNVQLMASDSGRASRTVYATLALTIVAKPGAPTITTQPASLVLVQGGSGSLTVAASGAGPLGYAWLWNGAPVPAQAAATLALSSVTSLQEGSYQAVVTNSFGAVTSSVAKVTVLAPPTLVQSPVSTSVFVGDPVTLTVAATGAAPLSYVWSLNGAPVPGATGPSLVIPAAAATDAGDYVVVVSNAAGSATSPVATLTVTPMDPPQITSIAFIPGGIRLGIKSVASRACQVFSSVDLATWELRGSATLASGVTVFDDPAADGLPARFYRVQLQ